LITWLLSQEPGWLVRITCASAADFIVIVRNLDALMKRNAGDDLMRGVGQSANCRIRHGPGGRSGRRRKREHGRRSLVPSGNAPATRVTSRERPAVAPTGAN